MQSVTLASGSKTNAAERKSFAYYYAATHFDPHIAFHAAFFESLNYDSLNTFLKDVDRNISTIEKDCARLAASQATASYDLSRIIHDSSKNLQFTTVYGSKLPIVWAAVAYQEQRLKHLQLQISMMQRELMLAVSVAWTWLDVDIPTLCWAILLKKGAYTGFAFLSVYLPLIAVKKTEENKWLFQLITDIRTHYGKRGNETKFQASKYGFVLGPSPAGTHTLKLQGSAPTIEEHRHLKIVGDVVTLLRAWLCFPKDVSRLQVTFIRALTGAFPNIDILLLPGVFTAYTHVHKTFFPPGTVRGSRIDPVVFDPIALTFTTHPLHDPSSRESALLETISEKLRVYNAEWRRLSSGRSSTREFLPPYFIHD